MALGYLRGVPKPRHFPTDDRKAIRLHFGSFDYALNLWHRTLFDIGDATKIEKSCLKSEVGVQDEQALYIHRSGVPYLDALLQTYIGAGRLFYGTIDEREALDSRVDLHLQLHVERNRFPVSYRLVVYRRTS